MCAAVAAAAAGTALLSKLWYCVCTGLWLVRGLGHHNRRTQICGNLSLHKSLRWTYVRPCNGHSTRPRQALQLFGAELGRRVIGEAGVVFANATFWQTK